MIQSGPIRVERLTSGEQLSALRAGWNALAGGVPFRTFEWLEAWWRSYGAATDKELLVLAAFDQEQRLAGLAPWYLERSSTRGRVIRFLGSGEVCSDYLTVLCRRGWEEHVTRNMAQWLCVEPRAERPRWDLLELSAAYDGDAAVTCLLYHLVAYGKSVQRQGRPSCWRVNLPGDWPIYLASLSKSHRKQIRRLERTYFETSRAVLNVAQTPAALDQGLEVLMRLHQRRRESLGERGRFASPRFAAFHEQAAHRLLSMGSLRLVWLELDGQTVAAEYQVLGDGVVYAYQSGIEPTALEHEPGRLITLGTLRMAIDEGRHAFDFLRGDEAYKAHWRAHPRPTLDIRVVSNTASARLRNQLWSAGAHVKQWLRHNLGAPAMPSS